MEKQFVTYEIALKLKELGFDRDCFGYYKPVKDWMMKDKYSDGRLHFHGPNWVNRDNTMHFMYTQNLFGDRTVTIKNSLFTKEINNIAVPLWQQAIEWIWSYHKILIHIHLIPDLPKTILWAVESDHIDYWGTQEEAVLQALELCAKRR